MIQSLLVHSATIRRPSHDKASQRKVMSEVVVATGVSCRMEAAGDSAIATMLGIGVDEAWRAFFASDADLQIGDLVEMESGPAVTATILGIEPRWGAGEVQNHFEVMLKTRDA